MGGTRCDVIPYLSTPTRLVCDTKPSTEAGALEVYVTVGEEKEALAAAFTYRASSTAHVHAVTPIAGPPGGTVSVSGTGPGFKSKQAGGPGAMRLGTMLIGGADQTAEEEGEDEPMGSANPQFELPSDADVGSFGVAFDGKRGLGKVKVS